MNWSKVKPFLKNSGWLVAIGLVIVLIFFPSMCSRIADRFTPLGFLRDIFQDRISDHFSRPDTVYVKPPISIQDPTHHWYTPVTHTELRVDTVTIVRYEQAPPTVRMVSATVVSEGRVRVEVMVNDTESRILEGALVPYGDTHIIVDPDSSIRFVGDRLGVDLILTGGFSNVGPLVSVETGFVNNLLGMDAVHIPNPVVSYSISKHEFQPGLGLSIDISSFHSPLRVGGGALYSIDNRKFEPFFSITTSIWNP